MSVLSIQPTYPIFTDIDGQPLEAGYVWIGTANLDPQTNPINVYWDAALTILAPQPIRTLAGYPSNNGTPARLYVNSDYSIRVMNRNGSTVYSAPTATERYSDVVVTDVKYTPGVNSLLTATTMSGALDQVSDKDTGASRVGYKQTGLNRIETTVQSKLREVDSIFDFMTEQQISDVRNAVQFDCSAIVETAISTLQSENKAALHFPAGIYYFANPVEINFDAQDGFRIYGESMANYMFFNVGGTRFTGAAGLESIFILTVTDLTQALGYTFECSHIFFRSGNNGATGPLTALKNKIGGAPARPFIVKNCGFLDFDKAIVSDISSTGGLTTGIGQVIIRENTFVSCGFALYGTGGLGNILDLIFCDNISENGGSIYVNQLGGTFNVSDNLLEGQTDALELNCGLAAGTVSRNYFEVNSGFLIKVTATNPNSQLVLGPQYILTSGGGRVLISNIQFEMQEKTLARNGILFDAPFGLGKNRVNNAGILNPASWANPNYRFDLNSIQTKTTVPPGAITGGQWVTQGGAAEDTPIGNLDVVAVTGNGTIMTPTLPLNANDAVVAMAIARRVSGNPFLYLTVADNTFGTVYIANSDTAQPLGDSAIGEWIFVMAIVRVPASSGGNPRIRWVANGGGTVDMSETYFYSVATPTNNSTPAYYFMPNP